LVFEHLGARLWAGKPRREPPKSPHALLQTGSPTPGAALIAQGQTSRQVVSALFITENTVQTHARHIFQKLGVRSRTELAARLLSDTASTATAATLPVRSEPR